MGRGVVGWDVDMLCNKIQLSSEYLSGKLFSLVTVVWLCVQQAKVQRKTCVYVCKLDKNCVNSCNCYVLLKKYANLTIT